MKLVYIICLEGKGSSSKQKGFLLPTSSNFRHVFLKGKPMLVYYYYFHVGMRDSEGCLKYLHGILMKHKEKTKFRDYFLIVL